MPNAEVSAIIRPKAPFGAARMHSLPRRFICKPGTAHHDITRRRDRLEGIAGVIQCSKIKHVVVP
jgi:hypothetical protein